MADYISRETLLKAVEKLDRLDKETNTKYEYDKKGYILLIQNAPTADVVEVKQIEIIRDDLKWWLETNTEKGVVYIPEFVVENMIAKMDSQL